MSILIQDERFAESDANIELEAKIVTKTAKLGVLGLGYVGLPLGLTLSDAGFNVPGIDKDTRRVEAIHTGRSYITDIKDVTLQKAARERRFRATTDLSELRNLDAVSICVPTLLRKTKDPDMSYVISAV